MEVSLDKVRRLRGETSARILDCKKALVETKGDLEEAKRILRRKGIEIAIKQCTELLEEGDGVVVLPPPFRRIQVHEETDHFRVPGPP